MTVKGKEEASPSGFAKNCNKQEEASNDPNEDGIAASKLQASQVRPIFIHRGDAIISTGNTSNSLLFSTRGDSSVQPILPSPLAQVETSMGNNTPLAPAPVDVIDIKSPAALSNRTKQGVQECQDSSELHSSNQRAAGTPLETPSSPQVLSTYQPLAPATSSGEESESSSKKREKPRKDRSKLRKGKWTVEEEEYTSRIIHHFSTGLLTLPEGTTLRSYLAEKLTCDPMRITKKFAGASCLGKRVYHLCDRSQATATEIEVAKQELGGLEHRFRLRVDHGQSGVPLPVNNVMPATPTVGYAVQQVAAPSWFATMPASGLPLAPNHALPQTGAPQVWPFPLPPAPLHFSIAPNQMAPPMHAQVHAGTHAAANLGIHAGHITMSAMPIPMPAPSHPSHMNKAANDAITSWAWAQAAASLTPALSQLAAANFQQHQQQLLQKAYESQLQSYAQQQHQQMPLPPSQPVSTQPGSNTMAPPAPLPPMFTMTVGGPIASLPPTLPLAVAASPVAPPLVTAPPPVVETPMEAQATNSNSPLRKERTKEDEDAGSMLMGFLSSLREGFIEAVNQKDKEEHERKNLKRPSPSRAADLSKTEISSGTTSHPAESSMEDSGSDKGKEGSSSSEESDKDALGDRPLGPPRKRMMMKKVSEFTSKNVAKHNRAMIALHGSNQNGFNQQHIPGRLEDPKKRQN